MHKKSSDSLDTEDAYRDQRKMESSSSASSKIDTLKDSKSIDKRPRARFKRAAPLLYKYRERSKSVGFDDQDQEAAASVSAAAAAASQVSVATPSGAHVTIRLENKQKMSQKLLKM